MAHKKLIEPFDFEVRFGEIVGLQGANGTGKSVFLKTIAGFFSPLSGELKFHEALAKPRGARFNAKIGICIDGPGFDADATGLQNLWRLARIRKVASKERLKHEMENFGLDPNSKLPMREYSLGMKQKIDLIQSFVEDQQLLLLDEPFNGLDSSSRLLLRNKLIEFKAAGKAIVLTSHSTEDWLDLADQMWRLADQRLTQE